jgi:hypothetical protein
VHVATRWTDPLGLSENCLNQTVLFSRRGILTVIEQKRFLADSRIRPKVLRSDGTSPSRVTITNMSHMMSYSCICDKLCTLCPLFLFRDPAVYLSASKSGTNDHEGYFVLD